MEVSDKIQFLYTFKFLCELFEKKFDEKFFKAYWKVFKKYSLRTVNEACMNYIGNENAIKFPLPAYIKREINLLQKTDRPQAKKEKTWEEELKELKADLRHWKRYEHAAEENNYLKICIANCENKIKEHLEKKEKI